RLQASAGKARRAGSAQGRVFRRHGDRRAAAYLRRRYRRGSQALRQAGDGAASGATQLAARQARRDRLYLAAPPGARRHVRGLRGRRVGHRRNAAARARRDRTAGGRARSELPAHLSVPGHDDAQPGAAFAGVVRERSDAPARAALIGVSFNAVGTAPPSPLLRTVRNCRARRWHEVTTMTNSRVTGVRSIELGVRDLHQSAEFYSKVWALE